MALAWGFLAGAALESAISVVVYDSGDQDLAGGLAWLPDLVSALLVNYSKDTIYENEQQLFSHINKRDKR